MLDWTECFFDMPLDFDLIENVEVLSEPKQDE